MVTFNHEMRQIYRVAGSDLDEPSLEVRLSVNQSERPLDGGTTYLAALRLALPTDPNVFDRENRLFPRAQEPQAGPVVNESYIVYPHLRPFADAARLSDAERNDSLYQKPLYLLHSGARREVPAPASLQQHRPGRSLHALARAPCRSEMAASRSCWEAGSSSATSTIGSPTSWDR